MKKSNPKSKGLASVVLKNKGITKQGHRRLLKYEALLAQINKTAKTLDKLKELI